MSTHPPVVVPSRRTVHVVLVNVNRWSDTIECLETVLRSDFGDTRVVVVDNGSTDDSVQRLVGWAYGAEPYQPPPGTALAGLSWPPVPKPVQHAVIEAANGVDEARHDLPRLTLITIPQNRGFAGGNNVALRLLLSTYPTGYALLLNNDMVVSAHAITALVHAIERDEKIAAMGGVIFDYKQPELVQMVGGGLSTRLGLVKVFGAGWKREQVPAPAELGFVGGGCLLIRLETLRDVGLLDEAFFVYGEDYDWGERMRKRGYRLTYTRDAALWHKGAGTVVSKSTFQDYHMVRAVLGFVRKHAPFTMPAALGYLVIRSLAPKIVRMEWSRARAVLRAYADHARSK